MNEFHVREGDLIGINWKIPAPKGDKYIRYVYADVNFWKSFVANRFVCPMGQVGCLSIFGKPPLSLKEKADKTLDAPLAAYADKSTVTEDHRMIFDHMLAEYSTKTEGRGRTVHEWGMKPGKTENHFFDCLVGCAVAASVNGATLDSHRKLEPQKPKRQKRIWKASKKK